MDQKRTVEEMARLKGFKVKQAKYSLLCSSLGQAAEYVRPMDRDTFSLLRDSLPGPFTFVMEASGSTPRHLQNSGHTIGIRVPACGATHAIVEELGMPLVVTSVRPLDSDGDEPEEYCDPELIHDHFGSRVWAVVDAGLNDAEPSTVVDCVNGIELVRQGKGLIDIE